MIRKANRDEISVIASLARKARNHMQSIGLNQWIGEYPNEVDFSKDMHSNGLFVYEHHGQILGSISILPENDLPYKIIQWQENDSLVVHRLFVDPDHQNEGIGMKLFHYAQILTRNDYLSLKVDTHPDNHRMQALILKMGFQYMGYIKSINRLAYEWLPK